MEVTGKVEVDLLHWEHLCITATGSTTLHTEAGAERWLTQCDYRLLADLVETECETDRNGCLTDTSLCGSDGSNKDKLTFLLTDEVQRQLCNVLSVMFEIIGIDTYLGSHVLNALKFGLLSNLDVTLHNFDIFVFILF